MHNVLEISLSSETESLVRCISATATLAGLLHDLGKSCKHFQAKLRSNTSHNTDTVRHERLSCAMLSALYETLFDQGLLSQGDDREFFNVLADCRPNALSKLFLTACEPNTLKKHYSPSSNSAIADLDQALWSNQESNNVCLFNAVYFLVLSHHKLPRHNHNDISEKGYVNDLADTPTPTLFNNTLFEDERWLSTFQEYCSVIAQLNTPSVYKQINAFTSALLFLARPALVIADQFVTRQAVNHASAIAYKGDNDTVYANTYTDKQEQQQLAQPLSDHLLEVSTASNLLFQELMDGLSNSLLPNLEESPTALTESTDNPAFDWQNHAVSLAQTLPEQGNLILICSETGSGKTRANAKVASALRRHKALRLTTLLGMNTLTKQTANEYLQNCTLQEAATVITGHAITRHLIDQQLESATGCENLDAPDIQVSGPDFTLPEHLQYHFKAKYNQILATPVVIATIDHMIETVHSGRSTATRLLQRLQSSDIIIDEIDSYHANSLVPIGKLVYLAGFYRRNLIVSSATLRPAVSQLLLNAFNSGLQHHNTLFGTAQPLTGAIISNLRNCSLTAYDAMQFTTIIHQQSRAAKNALQTLPVKRRLEYIDARTPEQMFTQAKRLHQSHHRTIQDLAVSVGLLRLNNIKYVQAVARALGQMQDPDVEIAIICYHSQIAAPVRYRLERCLDTLLGNTNETSRQQAWQQEPEFINSLKKAKSRGIQHIMLIIVCSPIEETGRDHDADFAIAEPCSHHSLTQLSGRVRRHRPASDLSAANVVMLKHSLKECYEPARRPYLSQPGAETRHLTLNTAIGTEQAFSCTDVDYTQRIDTQACLINYPLNACEQQHFDDLNTLEVQHVINAQRHLDEYINNPHCRLSESHARKHPLREQQHSIAVWYNGQDWVMPAFQTERGSTSKTVQCNWKRYQQPLPNLWFNQDVDSILESLSDDPKLVSLLTSEQSFFKIRGSIHGLPRKYFCPALGVFDVDEPW